MNRTSPTMLFRPVQAEMERSRGCALRPLGLPGAYTPDDDADTLGWFEGHLRAAGQGQLLDALKDSRRLVPELVVQRGVTHVLPAPAVRTADDSYTSHAWAGAVIQSVGYDGVMGSWTVPTVSRPSEAQGTEGGWNSSSWVGIDGFNTPRTSSNDVLQAGVQQRVDARGNATYVAWYEWYAPPRADSPGYVYQTDIADFPVRPGDEMYCAVNYVANNTMGALGLWNNTLNNHFSIDLAPPPGADMKGNTVEWIMEAPDGGEPVSSMPRFTDVNFGIAFGLGSSTVQQDPLHGDRTDLTAANGTVLTSTTLRSHGVTIAFTG